MLHWLRSSSSDTINDMEDYKTTSTDDVNASSSYIEDYATTSIDDNRREALLSPSTMELDQPGGSSDEHCDVTSNGTS